MPQISNLIQTNAMVNLDEEFEKIHKLDFSVSIDGFAKAHNQNRGENTFAKAVDFALKMYQKGARSVCIRAIVTKLNIFDFKNFEEEIKTKIGENAFLIITVPYSKNELIYAENSKVVRQNFDDDLLFNQKEAIKILQENYDKEFLQKVCPDMEINRRKANIYTYLSLMPEGVSVRGRKKLLIIPSQLKRLLIY
jgi:sulfatase maturation enzyme AslB (radical SAM superfamily)